MITDLTTDGGRDYLMFWCDGCETHHQVIVNSTTGWQWNGNRDAPTIAPSILVNQGSANPAVPVCHSFVRDGHIEYLSDSTHRLSGQTVPLEPLP